MDQLLLMSPLAIANMSATPPCSQRLWHAGKPYTVHRGVPVMSPCTCVVPGGAQTLRHIRQLPCYHSTAAAPKTKIIFH